MKKAPPGSAAVQEKIHLQLYVSGMTSKSMEAIQNIRRICNELPADAYDLEIIDIYKHPEAAAESHIVFSPSLIKRSPVPRKILIGTLSDTEKVLKTLGINHSK